MNFLVYNMEHSHLKLKRKESNLHGEKNYYILSYCKIKEFEICNYVWDGKRIMVGIGFPFGL